jgi:PII-like signaling protein
MDKTDHAALLRIFTRERARGGGRALYEAIVLKAREAGLAGATVLRGPLSFGQSKKLHNANILNLSDDLPIVIEIVDAEEKLRAFSRSLEDFKHIGLVTLEKVEILHSGDAGEGAR